MPLCPVPFVPFLWKISLSKCSKVPVLLSSHLSSPWVLPLLGEEELDLGLGGIGDALLATDEPWEPCEPRDSFSFCHVLLTCDDKLRLCHSPKFAPCHTIRTIRTNYKYTSTYTACVYMNVHISWIILVICYNSLSVYYRDITSWLLGLQLVLARLGVPGRKGAPAEHRACTVSLTAWNWNDACQRWSKHHLSIQRLQFSRILLECYELGDDLFTLCITLQDVVNIVISDNMVFQWVGLLRSRWPTAMIEERSKPTYNQNDIIKTCQKKTSK